jgi:hypothetical protein
MNFQELMKKMIELDQSVTEEKQSDGTDETEFKGYYYERLAQEVFDENPNLDTSGRDPEVLNAVFPLLVRDLGSRKKANNLLNYDEDFAADFVSAYGELKRNNSKQGSDTISKMFGGSAADLTKGLKIRDNVAEECGMPPSMADAPKQQDSVTMSVNMNGSGSGGIADLMAILRKIENSAPEGGDEMDMLVKKLPGFDNFVGGEQFANEPDEVYKNVDAVINPPSNGLNEPTQSYPAAAGGDNPMNIKPRLESLYNQIKNR